MPHKIKMCLPLQNDFGDMDKEDFSNWSSKLEAALSGDQVSAIKEYCEKIWSEGKISKNLAKNLKSI